MIRSLPKRVKIDSWSAISWSVPLWSRAADLGIFALVVLADDQHVDVARLLAGERRGHAVEQADRADIGILLEVAADRHEQRPQRHRVGHGRPADRAEEDRVVAGDAARGRPPASSGRSGRSGRSSSRTRPSRSSKPHFRPAASTTRMPSGTTSLPIPSPGMTAIRGFAIELRRKPSPTRDHTGADPIISFP